MSGQIVGIYRATLFNLSETFVQDQVAALDRYTPLVIGLVRKGTIRPDLEAKLFIPEGPIRRFQWRWLGRAKGVAKTLPQPRPCLLHAHFGTDGLTALALARKLQVPLITTLHGFDVGRTRRALISSGAVSHIRYALFGERLRRDGDLFLAVSDYLHQAAIRAGYPAERIVTHYNGVDLKRFQPEPCSVEPGLILHVGRLVEKKGTDLVISAFARIAEAHPMARLVILGDGPLRRSLEELAARLGVADKLQFCGHVTHEEVGTWMRRAGVLVAPSRTGADMDMEGLPTVVVEAAACGLPAIVSRHSGLPEAVDDGQSGFVVAEEDAEALAMRLSTILGDRDLRARMADKARAIAEQRFDLHRQAERLQIIYDQVLADAGRNSGVHGLPKQPDVSAAGGRAQ